MICCPADVLELVEQQDGAQLHLRLQLHLAEDLMHFHGHFPTQAILPGATLVAWAVAFANTYFHTQFYAESMRQIKFHQPVRPPQQITLEILYQKQQQSLAFVYTNSQQTCCARGQIKVIQRDD